MANEDEQIPLQQIIPHQPPIIVDHQRRESLTDIKIYLAVLSSNLLSLCCGLCLGWSKDLSVDFRSFVRGEVVVHSDFGLINLVLFIAATVIPLFVTFPVTKFGRKLVLIASATDLLMSFLLCAFAETTLLLFHIGRGAQGIGVGTALTVLPMYLSEISSNAMRGLCTGSIILFLQIGSVVASFLSDLLSLKFFSLLCLILLIVFLVVFSWWNPESPVFLALAGKHQQLEDSLRVLQKDVHEETHNINQYIEIVKQQQGFKNFFKKGFFLVLLLFICHGIVRDHNFLLFITLILYHRELPMSDINLFTNIIIPILATLLALCTVDKFGRKALLLLSTIGSAIVLIIATILLYLFQDHSYSLSFWTMFVLQLLCLFFSYFGLVIVPWVLLGEFIAHPQKAVAFALIISCFLASNLLFEFLFSIFFIYIRAEIFSGVFAIMNLLIACLVFLLIPETKKMSLVKIQCLLHRHVK